MTGTQGAMPTPQPDERVEAMLAVLKRSAAALRDRDIPYALAGGLGLWARGAPVSDHDVDLLVKADDVDRSLAALGDIGFETCRPPEGWLVKAVDGDVVVDLIFDPTGVTVDDDLLARCDDVNVYAMPMPVARPEDIVISRLLSQTEQSMDYEGLLGSARALREQIDWGEVRARTAHSPFAAAFFVLCEGLLIIAP